MKRLTGLTMAAALVALTLAGCEPSGGMVPARKVADDHGLVAQYNRDADTVTLTGRGNTVVAATGSDIVSINGRMVPLGQFVSYNGAEVFFPRSIYDALKANLRR